MLQLRTAKSNRHCSCYVIGKILPEVGGSSVIGTTPGTGGFRTAKVIKNDKTRIYRG